MAVSQPSNQVNVWKKPIGVKLVKKWGLSRSLDVFHAFFKNDQVAELMLISIKVQESAGTLRLLVRVDDTIRTVIQTALRSYSRQGRFPVLGSNNFDDFFLYCANSDFIALSPVVPIGRTGGRNFPLYKKKEEYYFGEQHKQQRRRGGMVKGTPSYGLINLSFNLLSH
ncbi:uncharacterized protein LOC110006499 [Amborella trichopoda]|uniref:uncharacterized protein LOC110006499 n=1 Tax=Amborella trichopoda TaxID=13333 RepID=UPI0009BEE3A5|nr:uncharacterized protein LOC110006499 [Amborella trichopoda]|eukprot:XP_020517789.1 uncharacterized protein LOC110006499 [Amborella trichopoda]